MRRDTGFYRDELQVLGSGGRICNLFVNKSRTRFKVEVVEDVTSTNSRLENLASKSLDFLEQILDSPESRIADRVQAAKL